MEIHAKGFSSGRDLSLNFNNAKVVFGENLTLRKRCSVLVHGGNLTIGNNVFFNDQCSIACLYDILIGDDCLFGENIKIYDHNHNFREDALIRTSGFTYKKVIIGNNCWIGSNVCILAGSVIGDDSVIGANAVVHGNIPRKNDSI